MKAGRLELSVFVAGFAVMVVEISGARLLAPYLGDTLFSWTSAISVVLGSLGIGYYLGGKVASVQSNLRVLALFLFVAGIFTALIPVLSESVLPSSLSVGFEYGPLFASVLLFAVPNVFLGMVAPYAIKLKVRNLKRVGERAGNLYAISTVGSISGALLSGYYLIPYVGIAQSFYAAGLVLAICGVLNYGRKGLLALAVVLAISLIPYSWPPLGPGRVIYSTDTPYYHLEVVNYSGTTVLQYDVSGWQTIYPNSQNYSNFSAISYYKYQDLFYPGGNAANSVLYLGLGGGAMVSDMYENSNALITVVEIDPGVIAVAKKYFNITDNDRITIYNQDARFFLRNSTGTYDLIVLDTYGTGLSMPYQMTTLEADQEMYTHLTPNGSLLVNVVSPVAGNDSCVFGSEYRTLSTIFPYMYVFPIEPEKLTELQNVEILASNRGYPEQEMINALNGTLTSAQAEWITDGNYSRSFNASNCTILTDNNNMYDVYAAEELQHIS